ncbi:MAG: hypothetical protein JWM12_4124 [Ilumatobacteraceae bacterium]|nr:hypothetical protein [Ilumatobacteraceae bacterium]
MSWLVAGGRVLASAEVAVTHRDKARGLLGRDSIEGAFVIPRCRWIHTLGMRFPIDVAYLDGDGVVIKCLRVGRHRVVLPVIQAHTVVEAAAGAFERWGLQVGDTVELRPANSRDDGSTTEQRATG